MGHSIIKGILPEDRQAWECRGESYTHLYGTCEGGQECGSIIKEGALAMGEENHTD